MYPIRPQVPRQVTITLVSLLIILIIFLAGSCGPGNKGSKEAPKAVSLSFEDSLYQSLVYTALSYRGDSLLKHLDSILPKAYDDNYRVKAYRGFLYGYKIFRQGKIDSAEHIFQSMLPNSGLDTARDYELLTLQKGAILRMNLKKGATAAAINQVMSALRLVEKYPARFRWWIYTMANEAWYNTGETLKAKSYARLAYQAIPDTGDYALRGVLMYHISEVEGVQDNLTEALKYIDSAHIFAAKSEDKKLLSAVLSTKAFVLTKLGDTAQANRLQRLALAQSKGVDNDQLAWQYFNTATINYDAKNFEKAVYYGKKASVLMVEIGNDHGTSSAYKIIADAYHQLRQQDSSYHYLVLSYRHYTQYLNELQIKEIATLDLQHNLEKETNEKQGLTEKNKAQQAEIKSQSTIVSQQRIIIFGAVAVFILLIALVYVTLRQGRLLAAKVSAETEKEKIHLQQQLYRSQMEPHFISNTLAATIAFMRSGDFQMAQEHLTRFGKLLRVNLEHSMQPLVSLPREIEALENYIALQHMRFRSFFDYHIDVYEGYDEDDLYIPPMLLQPFVENAIYHGLRSIDYMGQLAVVIRREGDTLHCEIEDNGRGLQNAESTGKRKSFATHITRERLRLLSKTGSNKANLQVIDKAQDGGQGTLIILDIPCQVSAHDPSIAFSLTNN